MRSFIRRVPSLRALKQEGIDERFFQGQDYTEVPSPVVSILSNWCKDNGIANTALPSAGAASDEAQEVYYVKLVTKAGRDEFKAMLKELVPALAASVVKAASLLTTENFLASHANGASDDLVAIIAFRDALMRFGTKPSKSKPAKSVDADPTLIIGV